MSTPIKRVDEPRRRGGRGRESTPTSRWARRPSRRPAAAAVPADRAIVPADPVVRRVDPAFDGDARLCDAQACAAPLHAAAAAAAGEGTAAVGTRRGRPVAPALAALLAGHVLRDGEVVQLAIKPSLWFIPFVAAKFAAAMAILAIASTLWLPPGVAWYWVEAALFIAAGRVMWAVLQWINRLYVLTDHRVLRLSGVFTLDIFDCPLRKVAATRVVYSVRERLLRLGSVEIQPADDQRPAGLWQTVARPGEVHEVVQAAVLKAKCGGGTGLGA